MTETAELPRKETVAQRVERIKRVKPSWSILDDIRRYAREGFASIPEEDLGVRFRAWGLYTQGDGRGTRGEEQPFFMMRVRTPNGLLTSAMVRTIANLSDRYARSSIDITNRQNFQLHWLRIEDVPTVWDELERVGWTSMGSCGDNTRTVKQGDQQVEGFDFFVGGGLGKGSTVAHRVGYRAVADEVPDALERMFAVFMAEREPQETVRGWTSRVGDAVIAAALAADGRTTALADATQRQLE